MTQIERASLLAVVAQGLGRFDAVMLSYCLMSNHYHFVVQTRQGNLSLLMRHINGAQIRGQVSIFKARPGPRPFR